MKKVFTRPLPDNGTDKPETRKSDSRDFAFKDHMLSPPQLSTRMDIYQHMFCQLFLDILSYLFIQMLTLFLQLYNNK